MKKQTSLVLATLLAATLLAACNKEPTSNTSTDKATSDSAAVASQSAERPAGQPTEAQLAQVYTKNFDATKEFTQYFIKNDNKAFNNSLPLVLRYDFNDILNYISATAPNIMSAVNEGNDVKLEYVTAFFLTKMNDAFTNRIADIKKDPAKHVVFDAYDFDLDQAYLPVLLRQLQKACTDNGLFQADTAKIAETLIIRDENGKALPFPQEQTEFLTKWNNSFMNACDATNYYVDYVSRPEFTFAETEAYVKEIQERDAEARKAEEAEKAADNAEKATEEKAAPKQ